MNEGGEMAAWLARPVERRRVLPRALSLAEVGVAAEEAEFNYNVSFYKIAALGVAAIGLAVSAPTEAAGAQTTTKREVVIDSGLLAQIKNSTFYSLGEVDDVVADFSGVPKYKSREEPISHIFLRGETVIVHSRNGEDIGAVTKYEDVFGETEKFKCKGDTAEWECKRVFDDFFDDPEGGGGGGGGAGGGGGDGGAD